MAKHNTSSSTTNSNVRKQKGAKSRKRLHMTKIEDSAALQTTFSKRRNGLFKKAGELSTLCGVEASVLVFSPYGRPFIFSPYGRPFGFQTAIFHSVGTSTALHGGHDMDTNLCVENISLTPGGGDMAEVVEEEEVTGQEARNEFWWDQSIDKMKLQDLKEFQAALKGLRDNVVTHLDESKTRDLALRDFLAPN